MNTKPLISVVIPCLGTRPDFLAHFSSVLEACLRQEGDWELHVVANFPLPLLAHYLAGLPAAGRVHYHVRGTAGVNRARNLGAQRSRGEYILFLDDDCVLPHKQFLTALASRFRAHPEVSAWGGGYASAPGASWKTRGYNEMASAWLAPGEARLLGGNMAFRRGVFTGGHWFAEEIPSGGEEVEFLARLQAAGHTLRAAPELAVIHHADPRWRALVRRAWQQGRARPPMRRARRWRAGARLLRKPAALPFSLVHFPILAASQAAHSPKFARAVKSLRGGVAEEKRPN